MEDLDFYTCYTLFDISNHADESSELIASQKRNWDTVIQLVSLRAQPILIKNPTMLQADLSSYSFGDQFAGFHRIWTFQFGIDARDAFKKDQDPVAGLMEDCNLTPLNIGLNESADLIPACMLTDSLSRNTYFQRSR